MTAVRPPERGVRPPNRRELILAAATKLFARRGYEYVGMSEIADAVAVRPSALYRHFAGKEQLLAEIVLKGTADFAAAVAGLDATRGVDGMRELAGFVVDNRHIGALLGREVPHLAEESRARVRAGLDAITRLVAERIAAVRTELRADEADLLAAAALAVLRTPAFQRAELPRGEHCALLARLVKCVITAELPESTGDRVRRGPIGLRPFSRREALLDQAIVLFAERTYASVGIEDVAASLGIAGPSVYNHFTRKSDILATALQRGSAYLSVQMSDALAAADAPAPALSAIVSSYTRFAVLHPALIDLMISEVRSLPQPDREAAVAAQRNFVAELVHLLRQVDPSLSGAAARVRIQAMLLIAIDVARVPRLRELAAVVELVTAVSHQVLALSG